MARPTKLDDLVEKRILDVVREGNSYENAARVAGLSASTLHDWRARGKRGEDRYSEFLVRLEKARGEAEAASVAIVRTAATGGTWQAAAWWLERREPARWAKRDGGDQSASSERPMSEQPTEEVRERLATMIAESMDDPAVAEIVRTKLAIGADAAQ